MDTIFGILVVASIPFYWALQIWMARQYRGGWRWAALAPLMVMAPVLAFTIFAFAAQSNLWPLTMIFTSPVAALYLLFVAGLRYLT